MVATNGKIPLVRLWDDRIPETNSIGRLCAGAAALASYKKHFDFLNESPR